MREFAKKLSNDMGSCKFKTSACIQYCESTRNCAQFAAAIYFHTTKTGDGDSCLCENWNHYLTEVMTSPHTDFSDFETKIKNTAPDSMCLVYTTDVRLPWKNFHFFALEVREGGLYFYNSWKETFSAEWFSGIIGEDPVLNKLDDSDDQRMWKKFRYELYKSA